MEKLVQQQNIKAFRIAKLIEKQILKVSIANFADTMPIEI